MVLQIGSGGGRAGMKRGKTYRKDSAAAAGLLIVSVLLAGCAQGVAVTAETMETEVTTETMETEEAAETMETAVTAETTETEEAAVTAETAEAGKDIDFVQSFDASQAQTTGGVRLETKMSGYSQSGYLTGFEEETDGCSFQVEIPFSGSYDIVVVSAGIGGEKVNDISVDGEIVGSFTTESENFEESVLNRIYMEAGFHEIGIVKNWGWIALDSLRVSAAEDAPENRFSTAASPVNPKASERTRMLLQYLADSYGGYILSGQFADNGIYSPEIVTIKKVTDGKMPAILGLDFMDYTPSFAERGAVGKSVERAIEYDELGGIVTFCWHWGAPAEYQKENTLWYKSFYTENVDLDLTAVMNGQDEAGYELLLRDIDAIAAQIAVLQQADVPILFRPLHEASGGWFWWGASGPESYIALWKLVYERLTDYHGLDNLIWVWNGQSAEWYPGDRYVDIIGEDIYPGKRVYTSQSGKFAEAAAYSDTAKIVAMTENGCLFDPDLAFRDQAPWAWFCTWSGEFVVQPGYQLLSEEYTETDMVKKVYQHERVITLDELPDLKKYKVK